MDINILLVVILGLAYLTFLLTARIFLNKFSTIEEVFIRNNRRMAAILSIVHRTFTNNLDSLRAMKDLKQNLKIEKVKTPKDDPQIRRFREIEIRKLDSVRTVRRKEACTNLGIIGDDQARLGLERAILKENDYSVKVYLSNTLTDIRNNSSIPVLIDALIGSHRWYRTKAISNLMEFGSDLFPFFLKMRDTRSIELIELNVQFAEANFHDETRGYLFNFVDHFSEIKEEMRSIYEKNQNGTGRYKVQYLDEDMDKLLVRACKTLSNFYYLEFGVPKYWDHNNPIIRQNGYWALSKSNSTDNFKILLGKLHEDQYVRQITGMLTRMIEHNPRFLYLVENVFEKETDEIIKGRIVQVLSNRIEYYIMQLMTKNAQRARAILVQIIKNKKINELIGFINLNNDLDLENILADLVKLQVDPESEIGRELRIYLKKPFLEKCGFSAIQPERSARTHVKDKKLIYAEIAVMVLGFLSLPIIFVVRYWDVLPVAGMLNLLAQYITDFNYVVIYYSLALTAITLGLMVLSFSNVKKQAKLWNFKNISMLFKKRMLPSISIIAPAYNEEKSIVSSVKSLLNLKYPQFELIVVNDGSSDETLSRLISSFQLIRTDYQYKTSLSTAPIRGIYRNASLPNLVVIDKSNGGKADSLNAGINVANHEYFCGIDADSLLEPEALLRLASLTLDEVTETPALGGNILPINSCKVDNGQIHEIHVPKNLVARLQTVEYLRAFMIGRLGWQQINAMLIISGAFGLFRRDRIIDIGGYLTSKGKYQKDTVGEDMELVVRISRMLREIKKKFVTLYAYNANCWTEVPEDLKSLKGQRYRWQRGLVDILFFHRNMLFNPQYGITGLIAMPYFLIFETIGPIFEIQGYFLIFLAWLLNILNVKVAMMLFISAILMGVINSLVALMIAEREERYFSIGDLSKLVFLAIVENFGPRQLISLWRVLGQIQLISGQSGWGKIKRKGI